MSEKIVLSRVLPLLFFLIGVGLLIKATLYTKRTFAFLGRTLETTKSLFKAEKGPGNIYELSVLGGEIWQTKIVK